MTGSKRLRLFLLGSRDKAIDETRQPCHPSSLAKLFMSHSLLFTLSEDST